MRALALVALAGCGRVAFDPIRSSDGGADAGATAHCGGPLAVTDNFDDGAKAPTWQSFVDDPALTLAETGGELVVTLGDSLPSPEYAGYIQSRTTDLRGTRVFVEVTRVPTGVGEAAFAMIGGPAENIDISTRSGYLFADQRVAGVSGALMSMPYDPIAHRWWQIREDAGTVYFETSPDGVTFTPFATTPTPPYAQYPVIELYAGTYSPQAAPGEAHFDNLNGGGAPLESWCKASSFSDDFSDSSYVQKWGRSYMLGACTLAENGGQAVISLTTAGGDYCAFITSADFDFTGDAAYTHVTATPDPNALNSYSYFQVDLGNGTYFEILQQLTDLVCVESINTVTQQDCRVPHDPAAQAYWRIHQTGGGIAWEVSPDATTWTPLFTKSFALDFTDVSVLLGAGVDSNTTPPGGASFDTYNK